MSNRTSELLKSHLRGTLCDAARGEAFGKNGALDKCIVKIIFSNPCTPEQLKERIELCTEAKHRFDVYKWVVGEKQDLTNTVFDLCFCDSFDVTAFREKYNLK